MQRVQWAAQTHEAHIVEDLLRAHGIAAWTFDGGIVRLDWLKTLAFGGSRVIVAVIDVEPARRIVDGYRKSEFALADEQVERAPCPSCQQCTGEDDPLPRRALFLRLLSGWLLPAALLLGNATSTMVWIIGAFLALDLIVILPGFAAWAIKWRFLCTNYGHAWRGPPPLRYQAMASTVERELERYAGMAGSRANG